MAFQKNESLVAKKGKQVREASHVNCVKKQLVIRGVSNKLIRFIRHILVVDIYIGFEVNKKKYMLIVWICLN